MRNFNKDNRSRGSRGGRPFGGRDSRDERSHSSGFRNNSMHDAVCDECGNSCQVPFRPTSGKPVYCSDCFEKRGNGNDNSRGSRRESFDRPNFGNRNAAPTHQHHNDKDNKQLELLNVKLDKILKLLNTLTQKETVPVTSTKSADKSEVVAEDLASMEAEPVETEVVRPAKEKTKTKPKKAKAKKE